MACLRHGLTAVILNPAGGENEQRNLIGLHGLKGSKS